MRYTYRTCENCLWGDKCPQATTCEYFEPADDSEAVSAYEEDLRERAEDYEEFVAEQNT